ncbi:unnamed protein product [Closterium sp. NIES-53]
MFPSMTTRPALPYLFPDLSTFATVADLITHLRTSDLRYRAALPPDFLAKNPPPRCTSHCTTLSPASLTPFALGAPPPPSSPPLHLQLLSASSELRGSGPRLLLVGGARATGARGAGVVEVEAGAAAVEGVGGAGVVAEVGVARVVGGSVGDRWADLLRKGIDIFALDYDAILAAMYALTISAEGDCYLSVPPDPGIGTCEAAALGASATAALGPGEAAALGASASTSVGTAPTEALHTFTLDSGASRCFFRDRTALEQLPRPVAIFLADPSGGPVLATSTTALPCPAVPSGTLSGLYLPSFSTNLVAGSALQDAGVHQFTPAYERVTHCTCARTGRHLATFTRQPGSDLYTLTTESPQVAASASGQLSAPCSCRSLSHRTVLWHHRLGHPSVQRLQSMHSRYLVSGLPRVLPPLPPSPAPPCLPCVEGRQRAAPHSSSFPPTAAPLQTLHLDVWGPARVPGQGHERYFLLVVDDYTRYTTVFPLCTKGEVPDVLIPWIRAACLQLRERFQSDFPVLRLHSDRGGEFSSDLLAAYCAEHGIRQTFTLPASPQQNGVAECRIGLVMEVARTSMIHAAAPHFLWPFAVQYAAHQLNLWPRVSVPETSPTLRWTGEVGDASVFRVWGCLAFVRDTSADKLSSRAIPCVFLGLVPDVPGWQFYHPTSRHVFASQDVTFEESVPFYHLFPYRTAPLPPPAALPHPMCPVAVDSGPARGAERAEPGGAGSGGTETGGAEPGGAGNGGAQPGGAGTRGAEPGGVETAGAEPGGAEHGGAAAGRAGAAGGAAGAGSTGGAGAAGGTGAAGVAASASSAGGSGAVSAASWGTSRPRPYFVLLLQQVLGQPPPPSPPPSLECPLPPESRPVSPVSRPVSPVRATHTGRRVPRERPPPVPGTHSMTLRPSTAPQRVPLPSPPASSLPALADPESDRVRATSPTVTNLVATVVIDPSFESAAASALVAELVDFGAHCRPDYAASLVDESESVCPPSVGGECALGTDVLEDRQEDLECLAAAAPHLVSMLIAPEGDPDAPDIPTPRSYAEAIAGEYSSQWHSAMDAEMASWKSIGTYVDEVPPLGANIVCGMWIFRVKRPPGSPPVFKACYVARGFSQREGVDFFQTFSPTPKITTLRVLLHVAAQRDYELHSLDFSTAFLQGSLHEEIWLRRPPGFTGSFPPGTQWSLRRPVYGLRQAPREWHDTLRTTLAALGFTPSTADPSLFLRTDTSLPPSYILVYVDDLVFAIADTEALAHVKARRTITLTQSHMVQQVLQRFGFTWSSSQTTPLAIGHSLSALPSDESVEPSGPYPELVGCLITSGMGLVLGGGSPVVLTGHSDASWVDDQATQRSASCEAEIYATAMAAQELRWLTYLLTDLGERPRSPPVLYVDNKAAIALCEEHRLEHRTKHIALRNFLARELQQRGQLRLRFVASQANTAYIFTKALQSGDHQPCFGFLDWSCDPLFSPT